MRSTVARLPWTVPKQWQVPLDLADQARTSSHEHPGLRHGATEPTCRAYGDHDLERRRIGQEDWRQRPRFMNGPQVPCHSGPRWDCMDPRRASTERSSAPGLSLSCERRGRVVVDTVAMAQ